ncbi:MAG: hypothetical protein U0263_10025 [Polyangiaceae bacterium]
MNPIFPVSLPAAEGTLQPAPAAPGFGSALDRAIGGAGKVEARRTRLSGSDAAQALERAWTARHGRAPTRETVAVLTAQWAHETGRGASMYNFNFGGIKGAGPSGLSVEQRTREGSGATEVTITDRFRAYHTAEEGADDYLALLEKRFPGALAAAERGDAAGFVRELKARGYFTGNEGAYTRSVTSMASAALERGFDALGEGAPGAKARLDLPVSRPRSVAGMELSPELVQALGEESDTPFVSAMAIADELSRSAMRILGGDGSERRSAE